MKSHLQYITISENERHLNREMSNKEYYAFWYHQYMFWPEKDLLSTLEGLKRPEGSFEKLCNPNIQMHIQICEEILADRGE